MQKTCGELLKEKQKQASTITNAKTEQTFTFKIPQTYHMESTTPRIDVEIHIKADTIDKTFIKENLTIIFNTLLETFS